MAGNAGVITAASQPNAAERGGDLRPHIAPQSGIDLLEQDARPIHRKPLGQLVHDLAQLGRAQIAALGADGQHAGFLAMGIQANVGPVPAPRKMHRGVTGAGEIVGDEQALEVRGWRHAAYYGNLGTCMKNHHRSSRRSSHRGEKARGGEENDDFDLWSSAACGRSWARAKAARPGRRGFAGSRSGRRPGSGWSGSRYLAVTPISFYAHRWPAGAPAGSARRREGQLNGRSGRRPRLPARLWIVAPARLSVSLERLAAERTDTADALVCSRQR